MAAKEAASDDITKLLQLVVRNDWSATDVWGASAAKYVSNNLIIAVAAIT